ncbi:hypothetical protein [Lentilactobacillus sp. Marseille-Q4993]|uniref:hypothetical protein n=1 Tax=Lentilactobacillus sp. Marseille-Q4993 TaxID=3039492 RepID=UPI0024BBF26C|nr:hypothetical protein [Lentilactobacillus sp. Marseille-Q4993]
MAVAAGMLSLTVIWAQTLKNENIAERQFFSTFKSAWDSQQSLAKLTGERSVIRIDDKVRVYRGKTNLVDEFDVPKEIEPLAFYHIEITDDGFIAPQTIKWVEKKTNKVKYIQKVQLGWSGFNLEEKQ